MADGKENIVMFPFMAQSHMMAYLALALHIEKHKGYTTTFVSTPFHIERFRSSIPSNSSIRFAELPFCATDHGLPPDCESASNLPEHLKDKRLEAYLTLKPAFEKLVGDLVHQQNGHPPLCIISDPQHTWCADVAHKYGVFNAVFLASLYSNTLLFSLLQNFTSTEVSPPADPKDSGLVLGPTLDRLRKDYLEYSKLLVVELSKVDGFLFNSAEGLDDSGLNLLKRQFNRPAWRIGPIVLNAGGANRGGKESGMSTSYIIGWLDAKPPNSVLYIAFGSEQSPYGNHMMQLGTALEASGKSFILVIKPLAERDMDGEYLPKGFEQRVTSQNKGLLLRNWAPQLEILSHKSIGAFLTHCGWNSFIEALIQGKPVLGWPLDTDQFANLKLMVEEVGTCVEVAKGLDCEVSWKDMVAKIELVMSDSKKAIEMREKACKMKELLNDAMRDDENCKGSSSKSLSDFLNAAFEMRRSNQQDGNIRVWFA